MRYTYLGLNVKPLSSTFRCVAGGRCVDISVDDARSTISSATVNADDVLDETGAPFKVAP